SGWQRVDATGALIPTSQLRQLFEYYLSALGEESMPQLVARIEQALSQLQEPARSQALETLGAYLDYKLAVADLEMAYSSADPADMERRMREIHALRRTWFDADTVGAFFANEEAVDEFQVAQRRILSNDALNPEQRAAALAEAESALPEPVRTARKQTRRFSEYEEVQQTLADDPQALNAWREDAFGAEAAGRLAELEQKQQDWNRRWQAYSSARDELLASSGLAGPEVEAALERLRNSHFNGAERVRAKALDSIR
ncbi:MAG: lipase, partial [Gammaproteobacteria bacterium]